MAVKQRPRAQEAAAVENQPEFHVQRVASINLERNAKMNIPIQMQMVDQVLMKRGLNTAFENRLNGI